VAAARRAGNRDALSDDGGSPNGAHASMAWPEQP
jgi:hypothetical protein